MIIFMRAGLPLVGISGAQSPSFILASAGSALGSVLIAQVQSLVDLNGILADKGAFPDGQWLQSGAKGFSDATVTDGTARWSVKE